LCSSRDVPTEAKLAAIISSFIAVAGSLTPTVIMVVSFLPLITGLPLLSSHAASCALP
jgi:uncharacterized membrane protein YjjP (DUF1212 family)